VACREAALFSRSVNDLLVTEMTPRVPRPLLFDEGQHRSELFHLRELHVDNIVPISIALESDGGSARPTLFLGLHEKGPVNIVRARRCTGRQIKRSIGDDERPDKAAN